MRKLRIHLAIIALTGLLAPSSNASAQKIFKDWPMGTEPAAIGLFVANHYLAGLFSNFGNPGLPQSITYPEVCTWYGALQFAKASGNKELAQKLTLRYEPLFAQSQSLVPKPDHVDHSVFGTIPLELYLQTNQTKYLEVGKPFADEQWQLPANPQPNQQELQAKGLSWQTRMWIDDMYMITVLQVEAFRATGNKEYLDRAAREMVVYLDAIQQPDGLFFHAADAPFLWGRGNGWMAAGMTELLSALPNSHADRTRIMDGYKKMMAALKKLQDKNYMWHQLLDDPNSWAETSCSGMFTYAIVTGVKKGWLEEKEYGPVAKNAWTTLVKYINESGDIRDVCEGTNKRNDQQYYLNRSRVTGDLHGQAPILWAAAALLAN
ncbi:glycoside hydrolase family 88/105 protein [Chitinophaga rhizophila]|uniref:Glycoside hydrolase family 88 protein n=1 Tax=Chitinophaga rhizophila TaxID=2866212 RepID=A0ABS7GJW6_9BACT|nr:glycoside hydrolase family 88 protein [Chitinophaga rhizophila]MBW8687681.1 glycoside hydrolase family 88 protein [Chitinophaga rhizophila]